VAKMSLRFLFPFTVVLMTEGDGSYIAHVHAPNKDRAFDLARKEARDVLGLSRATVETWPVAALFAGHQESL
jgi:hypothetical protein